MNLHPDIAHLEVLLGTWRGRGQGSYPTIESFGYVEEITFAHVGKPFIAYSQKTRHAETDLPLHAEAGYLRPVGTTGIELVIAQPSGIVEVHDGTVAVEGSRTVIELASTLVATTTTAKDATEVTRSITVDPAGELSYSVSMAAVGQALQHHLAANLSRAEVS